MYNSTQVGSAASRRRRGWIVAAASAASVFVDPVTAMADFNPSWSTLQSFVGTSTPTSEMRSLRSIAVSRDSDYVFAGFIAGTASSGIRKIDITDGSIDATINLPSGRQAKGLAVDDRGNLFASASQDSGSPASRIRVYDESLSFLQEVSLSGSQRIGGMALRKSGTDYQLYVAREASSSAVIERYNINNTAAITLDPTFGTGGQLNVQAAFPGTNNLTGLDVADDGTIYATSRDNNAMYKYSADLSTSSSVTLNRPMDVKLEGGFAFVSSYAGTNSKVFVVHHLTLSLTQELTTGISRPNNAEGYSGIDFDNLARIVVADQIYQNSPSSEFRDRILMSTPVPEPAAVGILALSGILCRRRR